jgi:hypothetical protein
VTEELAGDPAEVPAAVPAKQPLYWRVLRLRNIRPNGWQRATFAEGSFVVAAILVLADVATAWLLIVFPVVVAVLVKLHDVYVGWIDPARGSPGSSGLS